MSGAQAMILAAGRGERMRPLTDTTPKPLLKVRGQPLIDWHLAGLAAAGIEDVAINTAWLGEQFVEHFAVRGEGRPRVLWSHEGRDFGGALETAGGVARALPLLDDVFWLLAGDVYVPGFEFSPASMERFRSGGMLAHLWLVPNPPHNANGDFALDPQGLVTREGSRPFTYSTLGLYRQEFFAALPAGNPHGVKAAMLPLLLAAIDSGRLSGELYAGAWTDVGTPARLAQLNGAPA